MDIADFSKRKLQTAGTNTGDNLSVPGAYWSPVLSEWVLPPSVAPAPLYQPDNEKDAWELLPFDGVREIVKVLQYGAKKHSPRGWEHGLSYTAVFAKIMRHLFEYMKGNDIDPESGLLHIAHAGCEVLFLITFAVRLFNGSNCDDRKKFNGRI